MKVLQFLSDWKWTGPAEPVVRLCRALRERGVDVEFLCKAAPFVAKALEGLPSEAAASALRLHSGPTLILSNGSAAKEGGLPSIAADLHPLTMLRLKKSPNLIANLRDIRALAQYLDESRIDIVHVNTSHDHIIGSRAARGSLRKPAVIRTNHTGVPLKTGYWTRRMVKGFTNGMVEMSDLALEADARTFGLSAESMLRVEGSIDLERFRPDAAVQDMRPRLGLRPDDIVVGMVARIQRHRRFDVFLRAMKIAGERCGQIRGLIVGRGTHKREVAQLPARKIGIADRVIFTGYRGEDYASVLAAMDFMVYLVPGSDGSCRAVREAMAMGKPIVAANRGLLPELVEDGARSASLRPQTEGRGETERSGAADIEGDRVAGLVVDDTVENLAAAMLRLAEDEQLRKRLGAAAARKASQRFSIGEQADAILSLYRALNAKRPVGLP